MSEDLPKIGKKQPRENEDGDSADFTRRSDRQDGKERRSSDNNRDRESYPPRGFDNRPRFILHKSSQLNTSDLYHFHSHHDHSDVIVIFPGVLMEEDGEEEAEDGEVEEAIRMVAGGAADMEAEAAEGPLLL